MCNIKSFQNILRIFNGTFRIFYKNHLKFVQLFFFNKINSQKLFD